TNAAGEKTARAGCGLFLADANASPWWRSPRRSVILPSLMHPPSSRRALIEAIIASTIGTTIEWYDFFLYGTAAALVFPELFFPKYSPFAGQVLSFTTYAVGFVARPVGGAIFGYLGDHIGRKSTLVATLLL